MIDETFNKLSYVSLRPLSKGVDLDTPSHLLEVGSFLRLANVLVRRGGLERRGGYAQWGLQLPTLDGKVYASPLWYDIFGDPVSMLVTTKHLYRVDDAADAGTVVGSTPVLTLISKILHTDLSGVLATSGELFTLTTSGVDFTVGVDAGDTVWVGDADPATGTPYEVVGVAATVLTLRDHDGTLGGRVGSVAAYQVVEGFRRVPDWTVLREFTGAMYFVWTDNAERPLRRYDGTGTAESINGVDGSGDPYDITEVDTVTAFAGRLWIGGMSEDGVNERFRLRWTTLTNQGEFPISQYLDLPTLRSGVRRLIPLGSLLVAYFNDGVYFGRPTNIVNLPYDFTPYDTGNIGLVGPRAITSWLDAHWFVGQDDIYSFSASRALERIGTKVVKKTIQSPGVNLQDTMVMPDPGNDRILFQFFDNEGEVKDLWGYYYKTGAWASEPFGGQSVYFGRTIGGKSWDEIADGIAWTNSSFLKAWYTEKPVISDETLFRVKDSYVSYYADGSSTDEGSNSNPVAIEAIIESGDFDFDRPNILKTVTQLTLKFEFPTPEGVTFTIEGANNRGGAYRRLGTLRIDAGSDEGKVDFRMTGSLFRFRLTSDSIASPWTVNEIVLVVSEVGRESVFV